MRGLESNQSLVSAAPIAPIVLVHPARLMLTATLWQHATQTSTPSSTQSSTMLDDARRCSTMLYSSLWLYACSQVLAPVALVLLKLRLGSQNRAVDIRGRVDFHLILHFIRYYYCYYYHHHYYYCILLYITACGF